MGINQAQHVLRPHDVIPGHSSSLKVEGELRGRAGGGWGWGMGRVVFLDTFTIHPARRQAELWFLYSCSGCTQGLRGLRADSAQQPSGVGSHIRIMKWLKVGLQLMTRRILAETVH